MAVVLSACAFEIRTWFVLTCGPYAATTGFEEFCLYNVWKAAHGFPLYEWPQKEPFLLTSYNVGFYRVYAAWVGLWNATDSGLVLGTRTFTLLWTTLAAALQVYLVRRIVPRSTWSGRVDGRVRWRFYSGSTARIVRGCLSRRGRMRLRLRWRLRGSVLRLRLGNAIARGNGWLLRFAFSPPGVLSNPSC